MGILNITPDSFFEGSRKQTEADIASRTVEIVEQGGSIIDVGAFSTRPGANVVSEEEEMQRMRCGLSIVSNILEGLREASPDIMLSVDTFRPSVARMAVEEFGADMINDVSEGGKTGVVDTPLSEGDGIFKEVAHLQVPYILMSVQGDMENMVSGYIEDLARLKELGYSQTVILDPGYGFGKDVVRGNYDILARQKQLKDIFRLPLLAGVSRKRMIWQLLGTDADRALNGTTAVNMLSLERGADILRVHDVREAVETVRIFQEINKGY